tara:strand:- start:83 stop:523 length:441 start_codon:yes stop_codon:yes gene_type:complete
MIRTATVNDFAKLELMCAEFWQHAPYDVEYKAGSATPFLEMCLSHELLFVAEKDGDIIGFTAGCTIPLMGNIEILHGTELAWWVNPQHRGGSAGIRLLMALEDAARELGCMYWSMVFMETSMPKTVRGMYERLGYELKETSYGKRL